MTSKSCPLRFLLAAVVLPLLTVPGVKAQDATILVDFEDAADLALFGAAKGSATISSDHATHGGKSLRFTVGESLSSNRLPRDWSGNDSLDLDFFVEGSAPVTVSLLIGDDAWEKKRTYWNRHNGSFTLKPGPNSISLPVNGLFRGEAGSRGNDVKTDIDPRAITLIAMDFASTAPATMWMDNLRLRKESRPDGIIALDFGPESQPVFPGFTPISPVTVYGQNGAAVGWTRPGLANRGRDDTFPTRLYQDFVDPTIDDLELVAKVPNGPLTVWFVYSDCGYWGGEAATCRRRSIDAEGKEVFVDDRGDAGPTDSLFRFESVEPKPGDSVWDLYMAELFTPRTFTATISDGTLNLRFHSDAPWSSKIAAMIIFPQAKNAEAQKWIAEIEARNRAEFERRAVFMGSKPLALDIPASAKAKGWLVGYPTLDQAFAFDDAPGSAEGTLARPAARGQRISFTYAIRPLTDFGEVKITCSDLSGAAGKISTANVELRYVHHGLRRGINDIAYTILPLAVRRIAGSGLTLGKGLTRQFWTTVTVPAEAKPGTYTGAITITAGALTQTLPISVEVLDLTLDPLAFPLGYFGLDTPDTLPPARQTTALRDLMTTLHAYGMTSFSGGPNIAFTGFAADGTPQLDFSACDAFFATAKDCGFTQEVFSYAGPGMVNGLHDGYTIGATGRDWAQKTGKPFGEVLTIVWTAVAAHAQKAQWPTINYGFADEPRTIEDARALLELHKAYRDSVPFVRTGGFYSVDWGESDLDHVVQSCFAALTWSGLNLYKQIDFDKANELGREFYMYNQGDTRFTFGHYCWARIQQGVRGFMQWHTCGISGYQHFDLDGREPDYQMIQWGRDPGFTRQTRVTFGFERGRLATPKA